MITKPTLWIAACVLALAGMFSGCQSSKIAYGNSYYFKQSPKVVTKATPPIAPVEIAELPDQNELYVSTKKIPATSDAKTTIDKVRQQMLEVADKSNDQQLKEKAYRVNEIASSVQERTLNKQETRAKRKELNQELRSLAKEYRSMAPDQTNDLDKNLKISLILLVAGLIFLLIPTVVTIVIGSLAFAAGLVFLIIWLATEA